MTEAQEVALKQVFEIISLNNIHQEVFKVAVLEMLVIKSENERGEEPPSSWNPIKALDIAYEGLNRAYDETIGGNTASSFD